MNFLDGILFALFAEADKSAPLMVPRQRAEGQFRRNGPQRLANLDVDRLLQTCSPSRCGFSSRSSSRWLSTSSDAGSCGGSYLLDAVCERRRVDVSLRSFLRNTVRVVFTLLLVLIVVSTLGVNVTSLIAVFSAATLAIGMALSGTAQNFAGGVMILLMKPYRIGDYISAQGQSGTVREIKALLDGHHDRGQPDDLHSQQLHRHGHHRQLFDGRRAPRGLDRGHFLRRRRGHGPQDHPRHACGRSPRVAEPAEPVVWVSALADSSVNLTVRVWTKNSDFWDVFFRVQRAVLQGAPAAGINFPFPQMDVHVKNE